MFKKAIIFSFLFCPLLKEVSSTSLEEQAIALIQKRSGIHDIILINLTPASQKVIARQTATPVTVFEESNVQTINIYHAFRDTKSVAAIARISRCSLGNGSENALLLKRLEYFPLEMMFIVCEELFMQDDNDIVLYYESLLNNFELIYAFSGSKGRKCEQLYIMYYTNPRSSQIGHT